MKKITTFVVKIASCTYPLCGHKVIGFDFNTKKLN